LAKIPRFKSEKEIQEFWAAHDSADYFDDLEDEKVKVSFKNKRNVLVLPLDIDSLRKARGLALKEGISSNTLFKRWISEGIKRESGKPRNLNNRIK